MDTADARTFSCMDATSRTSQRTRDCSHSSFLQSTRSLFTRTRASGIKRTRNQRQEWHFLMSINSILAYTQWKVHSVVMTKGHLQNTILALRT